MVLLHLGGEHRWLRPSEARRLLDTVPTRTCPKCRGTGAVEHPRAGRCHQCQSLGRVLA